MNTRDLHDPELWPLIDTLPRPEFSDATIGRVREIFAALTPPPAPLPECVSMDEISIPGRPGEPDVRALRFSPPGEPRGTLLHFHGGGMVMGRPEHGTDRHAALCAQLGVTVIAPAYRLSPEHRAPAAVMDGLAALLWVARTEPLSRIVVSGDSAGGLMAVSTVAAARAHLPGPVALLHLVYPMLDPATGGPDCRALATSGEFIWTRESNRYGWDAYLDGADPVAAHVPAALEDVSDFPRVWIGTGSLDLFFAENLRFAERLADAGVSLDVNVYSGAPHAFNMVADAAVTLRFARDYMEALQRAFGPLP